MFCECVLNVVFFVFVLVVYLHLFSAAYENEALNTKVGVCLHSPHHIIGHYIRPLFTRDLEKYTAGGC